MTPRADCPGCGSKDLERIAGWSGTGGITSGPIAHPSDTDLQPITVCNSCGCRWDTFRHDNGPPPANG